MYMVRRVCCGRGEEEGVRERGKESSEGFSKFGFREERERDHTSDRPHSPCVLYFHPMENDSYFSASS